MKLIYERNLLTTDAKLKESMQLIKDYEKNGQPPVNVETEEKLWRAKTSKKNTLFLFSSSQGFYFTSSITRKNPPAI